MKFVSSMLVSLLLIFLLFSVFWATIFSGYIQYYGIAVFFNPFFINVFNPYAFILLVAIFGIGFVIPLINKLFKLLFIALLIGAVALFIPQFGAILFRNFSENYAARFELMRYPTAIIASKL